MQLIAVLDGEPGEGVKVPAVDSCYHLLRDQRNTLLRPELEQLARQDAVPHAHGTGSLLTAIASHADENPGQLLLFLEEVLT